MRLDAELIFDEARRRPAGVERNAYLDGACGGDAALRARIDALLRADAEAAGFLETVEPGPRGDAETKEHFGPTERAGAQIGRYKLLQVIGEGGFGTVWMAEQREPVKRRVVGMDTRQVIARFEAERQALAMMDHPNIARVLDAGSTETGRPYFVMEYVRGVGILEYCDTERLDTRARLSLFVKVCNAIQHAHQKGIIHRDIKPSNVLVTMHDGVPVPKVIDFGVAKATNSELTQRTLFTEHRQMIGTPAYMSPEQAEMSGLDIDTRSDIYSLGVLLYELLTGTTPFDSGELMKAGFAEMMRIIREQEPHKPSTRLSSLGASASRTAEQRLASDPRKLGLALRGDLDWIVMKCLEKDRTRRYETANGLAADVQRHLEDEPVVAGPPSRVYRVSKFLRRNRTGATAAAAVVALILLGLTGALVGLVHVRHERDRAREAELVAIEAQQQAASERDRALSAEQQARESESRARTAAAQAQAENERARVAEQRANTLRRFIEGNSLSLAVLPISNLSGSADQDHLAIGMTESLVADLNRIEAFDVRPASSVMRLVEQGLSPAELATQIGVDVLLEGRLRRADERLQISMSLIDPKNDLLLWSEFYDRPRNELFDLQREVSQDLVREASLQLTEQDHLRLARRQTPNEKAQEAYFYGIQNLRGGNKRELDKAVAFFDAAIGHDPEFAPAWEAKAWALGRSLGGNMIPHTTMPAAFDAATQALRLDDTLAVAHVVIGFVQLQYYWNWEAAREAFETALRLDPNRGEAWLGMASFHVSIGEVDEAIRYLREAVSRDPAVLLIRGNAYSVPFFARRFDVAVEMFERGVSLDEDSWTPHAWMGLALAQKGEIEEGLAHLEIAASVERNPVGLAMLASVYAMDGQEQAAGEILDEITEEWEADYVCPYEVATVFIAFGEMDLAIEWLDKGVHAQSECLPFLPVDPRFDPVREQRPRDFDRILHDVRHPLAGKPPRE
jgi:serine/threonine protein kinase/TolB-like protein